MFENYGYYAKQVRDAVASMPASKRNTFRKMSIGVMGSVIAIGGVGAMLTFTPPNDTQSIQSLETVKAALSSSKMKVVVAEEDPKELFDASTEHFSTSDREEIGRRISENITEKDLSDATVKIIDNSTSEVDFTAADGTPITAVVQKNDDGSFELASATAKIDKSAAAEKIVESKPNESALEAKKAAEAPLSDYNEKVFNQKSGIEIDEVDEDELTEYFAVIDDAVLMIVPDGFAEQELQSGDESTQADDKESEEPIKHDVESILPHASAYKGKNGEILNIRTENLGRAFAQMEGQVAVEKMMGYWKETSESMAKSTDQSIKDTSKGYTTKVFYDPSSGLWGYWGAVTFSDGTRDITYNRVVFIDEVTDQMHTVSYRCDTNAHSDNKAMTLDEFKELFFHAPGYGEARSEADGASAGSEGSLGTSENTGGSESADSTQKSTGAVPAKLTLAYKEVLDEVKVLPGHARSVAQEKAGDAAISKKNRDARGTQFEDAPQNSSEQERASSASNEE